VVDSAETDLATQVEAGVASPRPLSDPTHIGVSPVPGDLTAPLALTQSLAAPAFPVAVPAVVPGYEILSPLGRGGMGVVYKARQISLNRIVALKMLLAGPHASPGMLARFHAEAEAVARLQHPHIVQIYEVGQADGRPYLALEFVEGGSLAQYLHGQPQPPRQAAQLLVQLARAMHHAHRQGIIHRDLKPGNVLVTADGTPKITDFGLAKQVVGSGGHTKTGEIVGTPSYMAPEQASGVTKQISAQVDVYALGAILYEMLTGRPPFLSADPIETVLEVISHDPVAPRRLRPGLPRDLETICLKCLHKVPGRRYDSALALAEDLERFLAGEPIRGRPTGWLERVVKWVRRRPGAAALVGVSALAGVLLLGLSLFYNSQLAQERDGAVRAERAEKKQRRDAEERLQWLFLAEGNRAVDEGDSFGALPWLTEAAVLDQGNPHREEMHGRRVAAVLRQGPKLTQLWFHEGAINAAEFSPDGHRVVTASADQTARVWDVVTGQPVTPPLQHSGPVVSAAFDSKGRRLVTAVGTSSGARGEAYIWDAATGQRIGKTLRHPRPVIRAMFSPDNRRVLTACEDGRARLWVAGTGKLVLQFPRHLGPLRHAAFSPDGRRVVTASADNTARVWDTATGQAVTPPLVHPSPVNWAAFSPDGRQVVTAFGDVGTIGTGASTWDAATGDKLRTLTGLAEPVTFAAFSPDGRQIVTADIGTSAKLWDAASGVPFTLPLSHTGPIRAATFSPDGRRVATASGDGTARVWNTTRGFKSATSIAGILLNMLSGIWDRTWGLAITPPLRHNDQVTSAVFSPDGRFLLTAGRDGTARLWDLAGKRLRGTAVWHTGKVVQAEFSPDGRKILTASWDTTAQAWDTETGHTRSAPMWHAGSLNQAVYSPDGRKVVTVSVDCTARVWDAATGHPIGPRLRHPGRPFSAVFSPDSRRVLTGCDDGTVWVWDAAGGRELFRIQCHRGWVAAARFSPDGHFILTAGNDGTARTWNAATGKPAGPVLHHRRAVAAAAFAPDGQRVVTGCYDQTARIWNSATGEELTLPLKHNGAVLAVAFSPNGNRVATASGDGTARVWDARTGQPLTPPVKHGHYVFWVAFSPDGERVVTASNDQTARVWDAATGEPLTPPLKHQGPVNRVAFSPDGGRLVTAVGTNGVASGYAQIWELPRDDRPWDDLRLLSQVLTGVRVDARGRLAQVPARELRTAWQTLRSRYSAQFVAGNREVLAWHLQEALECETSGYRPAAISHLDQAIALEARAWSHYNRRGFSHAELGHWDQAAADLEKALDLGADHFWVWYNLALVRLRQGDKGGYWKVCTSALGRFANAPTPAMLGFPAYLSALAPGGSNLPRALAMARRALAGAREFALGHFFVGALLYRSGQFEEAVKELNESVRLHGQGGTISNGFFLAMAHQRLGHDQEARRWLDQTCKTLDSWTGATWNYREEWRLLRHEAESIVKHSR
jgi:WD40 repeat protein/tetratricopeptide (TPR) repeat protein